MAIITLISLVCLTKSPTLSQPLLFFESSVPFPATMTRVLHAMIKYYRITNMYTSSMAVKNSTDVTDTACTEIRLRVDIVLVAQFCRAYAGSDRFQYNPDLLFRCKFALYHDVCPPILYLMYMDADVLLLEGSTPIFPPTVTCPHSV